MFIAKSCYQKAAVWLKMFVPGPSILPLINTAAANYQAHGYTLNSGVHQIYLLYGRINGPVLAKKKTTKY